MELLIRPSRPSHVRSRSRSRTCILLPRPPYHTYEDNLRKYLEPISNVFHPRSHRFTLLVITAYNVLEFFLWLWDIFRARKGLYFYSMLIATIGLAGFNAMTFVNFFAPSQTLLQNIGFLLTVPTLMTEHILALYSRLHLLCSRVRNVFIGTVVLFTIPHTITLILYIVDDRRFAKANFTTERVAFTSYCVRELFVCGIYIVQGLREIRPIVKAKGAIGRKVMSHLIIGQAIVVVLDLSFIILMYMGRRRWGWKDYVETSSLGCFMG
ncbi:hypothetical protein BDW69DRAFT_181331 [Aspergillus filifer]